MLRSRAPLVRIYTRTRYSNDPGKAHMALVSTCLLVALLAPPAAPAPPRPTRVPFRFHENHVYLTARVNGSRPLTFLLDSGATRSYLDRRHAALLGPRETEESPGTATLRFGALEVRDLKLVPAPLTFGSYDGLTIDGLLGYDLFARYTVEVDYVRRTVTFGDPATYRPSGKAAVLPLVLLEDDSGGKLPLAEVSVVLGGFGPVTGRLIVDTAVRAALSFNTPFVEAHKLLERTPKAIPALVPGGAMVRKPDLQLGRVTEARVGPFVMRDVVGAFSRERAGILAVSDFDGVLGSEALRRFRVTFDYSRSQMSLEPNAKLGDRFDADASGLSLVATEDGGRGLRVFGVVPASPAAEAGIAEGDLLVAVDGRAVSAASLPRVRAGFRAQGRTYRLKIHRNGSARTVTLRLRALL
jgi:hypothetical protein